MEIFSRTLALICILILTPFYIIISICCISFQGFPILFTQERVGYKFRTFKIYKFRSMSFNSGEFITSPNDSRITKFGKILRKTKIDEIPQLFNILKGDMRFIGPRPEVRQYFSEEDFVFLSNVKPGISDFASIILRNESIILDKIGGDNPYEKLLPIKLELANYYSMNKSFWLDIQLVAITIISILLPDFAIRTFAVPLIKLRSRRSEVFLSKYIID